MTTTSTIKSLAERLKKELRDLTEFEDLYDELKARKDLDGTLSGLMELLWCLM